MSAQLRNLGFRLGLNMSNRMALVFTSGALLLALMLALPAMAGGRPLSASLSGAEEVPPADPDGSGAVHITLNQGQGRVCWEITVEDITLPASAAHIHVGAAGVVGGVVVTLSAPDGTGFASGCRNGIDRNLIKAIRQNPAGYYVNVHNSSFPGGAVRGQLSK